ncbi:CHASE3 domain-containing protein [Salinimonas marina]|uniref:histidine kinase n=1 Tax=Salinimonas marina TaxID=2785918 RepID=A0A7S9HE18_9ALTE|nr:sensor histidine kinase [Salinimonas marina]QPG06739.1 CHASE3 domain-containing protein [Salinimonas marina]
MFNKLFQSFYSWIFLVGVIVLIITGNSFYVVNTLDKLATLEARLFTTTRVITAINSLHMAVLRAESGQRGYLLTKDEAYLEDYTLTLERLEGLLEEVELSAQVSDLPEQDKKIQQLVSLSKAKVKEMAKTVNAALQGDFSQANRIIDSDRGLVLYDRFERVFEDIDRSERMVQGEHLSNLMKLRRDSVNTLIISGITTAFLIISIFVLIKMNMRENLRHQRTLEGVNEELEFKINQRTQELQIYSDELARSNRELEDFAFVASHDLQEPLRKIRAFGNRIDDGYADVIDERGRDFLNRMLNAAERMSMLISDLLAFSRVSTRGKDFTEVDLDETVKSVLDDLEIAIEESQATVEVDALPSIQADKSQAEQLFLNLLSNALKFKHPDTPPHIKILSRAAEAEEISTFHHKDDFEWVTICVQDNGIGFEQSFAEKIFAPFQRLHGRSSYKGTGIGLAVCRRIVERHNGQIRAFSEPGKGARFEIILPVNGEPFANLSSQGVVENDH